MILFTSPFLQPKPTVARSLSSTTELHSASLAPSLHSPSLQQYTFPATHPLLINNNNEGYALAAHHQPSLRPALRDLYLPVPTSLSHAFPAYCFNIAANFACVIILILCFAVPPSLRLQINSTTPIEQVDYFHPWIACFLVSYYCFALAVRWWETDAHVLYEHCWACNLVLLVASFGMITNQPICIGIACVVVAIDQMSWYIDVVGRVVLGFWPLGVAKYLEHPNTSFMKKITAWHHIWFLPLMLWTLGWQLPQYSFIAGSCLASATSLFARMTLPYCCLSVAVDKTTNCRKVCLILHNPL